MLNDSIPLDKIKMEKNIRTDIGDLASLMESIKIHGIIQPVGAYKDNGNYVLVWGHRRIKAVEKLGWNSIPKKSLLVIDKPDDLILNTVENIHRKDIGYLELAKVCNDLYDKGFSKSEIAVKLAMTKHKVTACIDTYRRLASKYYKYIGYSSDKKQKNIPLTTMSRIIMSRGLSDDEKRELIEATKHNEFTLAEVLFITEGTRTVPLKTLLQKLKTHKIRYIKIVINTALEEQLMKEQQMTHINKFYNKILTGEIPATKDLIL